MTFLCDIEYYRKEDTITDENEKWKVCRDSRKCIEALRGFTNKINVNIYLII